MQRAIGRVKLAVGLFVFAGGTYAADLKTNTLNAWDQYVDGAQKRMQGRLQPGGHFLWADEDAERAARIKQGETEVEPLLGHGSKGVQGGGLIHDWIGAAFIPNASLDELFGVLKDYDHYKDFYRPVVIDSQLKERVDDIDRFTMRWLHKVLFVTAALDTQNEARTYRVDARRAYTISRTINVQEIQNYGHDDEHELAPDKGNGFIWRLCSISRYEERDGGLYVEIEAMALTRDIPMSMRFLVRPVVMSLSRNSLVTSLEQTRDAVHETQVAREMGGSSQRGDMALLVHPMRKAGR
ncbi:MAG TPA: hypothetical protein VH325_08765 [Bryobacteraceae bacterium]|jgi:hypothetical protein|nr:hypothetical protein [Bryobacteraceae bacterium]